jgi:predicted nucleotide-binding protein (sugar kinase/HSP70/actin superfamily)
MAIHEQARGTEVDAELARFEAEERQRLGLNRRREHWHDERAGGFTASQRAHTTILCGGLTLAQDYLIEGALMGLGYRIRLLDVPDNDALRVGKEFGNRGQCNPTYFTVGNLVKYLIHLREDQGLSTQEIIDTHLFLTAGSCGPCRFGMYATEYRKALRDAGFEGFRVFLFQQEGNLNQATGEGVGLELNVRFFSKLLVAMLLGDVLNAIAYRLRPYELVPGATDAALQRSKDVLYHALKGRKWLLPALLACRREFSRVAIDRTIIKPKVAIIGEFWAMTTEGDGNYKLQGFLESEGAEVDVQPMINWILYCIWLNVFDTRERMMLRGQDTGVNSLKDASPTGAAKRVLMHKLADKALRGVFQTFAKFMGLEGYRLPDMDLIAKEAQEHFNVDVRGGEGHMEVGKLVVAVKKKKMTMMISVKPFGCMPSSGVSDGVQSIVTERYPDAIFLPIETTGDGAVNVYSRVQMMLFKARQAASKEVEEACARTGTSVERAQELGQRLPWLRRTLHHPPHVVSSSAANFIYEAAHWDRLLNLICRPWRTLAEARRQRQGCP